MWKKSLCVNSYTYTVPTKQVALLYVGPAKKLILGAVANPRLTTSHKIIAPPPQSTRPPRLQEDQNYVGQDKYQ
jgi:hypothetical protein